MLLEIVLDYDNVIPSLQSASLRLLSLHFEVKNGVVIGLLPFFNPCHYTGGVINVAFDLIQPKRPSDVFQVLLEGDVAVMDSLLSSSLI